jgi:hypothetical protein
LASDIILSTQFDDNEDGFKIIGEAASDFIGSTVSGAGDFNNDGILDVIVGGSNGESGGAGAAYVVFGNATEVAVNLSAVAGGSGGFKITSESGSNYVASVSNAGDVNGDGIDDIIVGDYLNGGTGAAYVVFGGASPTTNLATIATGVGGFKILGEVSGDQAGFSVSAAGDVNGDGIDDVIVGSRLFDNSYNEGAAYVIFGSTTVPASVNLSDVAQGSGGFRIDGESSVSGRAGSGVSAAGDVNGDGFDDVVVGAPEFQGDGTYGAAYVVFGAANFGSQVLLDNVSAGSGGFRLLGDNNYNAGSSVSAAGDVNGDGIADLLIGDKSNDAGGTNAGAAYVVFGTDQGFAASTDLETLAAGAGGFKITGEAVTDYAGISVSSAGDVNGDGLDDILVGAFANDGGGAGAGAAYLIFGVAGGSSSIDLSTVALGTGGIRLTGEAAGDGAGIAVSAAGDVNGDGFDDVLIGAESNDEGGNNAGGAYFLFGADVTGDVTDIGTAGNDTINAVGGNNVIVGGAGGDILNGLNGGEVIRGGAGDDFIQVGSEFQRVHGGAGTDKLGFIVGAGTSTTLDLTNLADLRIESIEEMRIATGSTDNTAGNLILGSSDIRQMSDTNTLTVDSTSNIFQDQSFHTVTLAGSWTVDNNLVDTFNDGDVSFEFASDLNITTTGSIDVTNDTLLQFAGGEGLWVVQGSFGISGTNTLTVDTGTLHIIDGALFDFGTGTVTTSGAGEFLNEGTFDGGNSPGAAVVDGDLTWGDTANMLFELGGLAPGVHEGFDQLLVSGDFEASGTINVVEFGEFEVSAGDSFSVVEAGVLNGEFDDITGLDVGGGVVLDATQSASGITLTGKAITHQGTAAGETLAGGSGDDVFAGEDGGDFIVGGGGADLMHGGDGDDVFVAGDTGFGRIDGGGGFDTVRFDGAAQGFDLTELRGDQINAIEMFDLTGGGDNTLILDADMIFSATRGENLLTGTDHSLIIDGDAGDAVDAGEGWSNTGTVTIGSDGYSIYENDNAGGQLVVNQDVTLTAA